MGLLDFFLKSTIDKRVANSLANSFVDNVSASIGDVSRFLNANALPAINSDGYNYTENMFKTIGAVYEVTDLISKKVVKCPLVFYKVKDKKKLQQSKSVEKSDPVQAYLLKMQAVEEIEDYGLKQMLANPNPFQTGDQLIWTIVLSYLLQGNTYAYGSKVGRKVKEMWCFPNMFIEANNLDLLDPILGYKLQNTAQTPFAKDEIYHLKTANPAPVDITMEYLYGVAPMRAYLESIRTLKEAKTQASKQVKNGGAFGILSPKNKEDRLTKEQKEALHTRMVEARKSNDEIARIFASSISLDWQSIGLPIAELQLLELMGASQEDVYRGYHVPLQYLNQKASTSNNQNTAVKQLIYDAVSPICDVITEFLTRFVGVGYGDIIIECDYTQLPEMAVNMAEVAKFITALPKGTLTPNEVRAAIRYGEKSEAYMNEHYVENGLVKLSSVYDGSAGNQPAEPTN